MIWIDVNQSVYDIIRTHPAFKTVLLEAGFTQLSEPGILETVGRFMTLQKGILLRGINQDELERIAQSNGFSLVRD
jgi:uncharacterized protein